MLEGEAPKRRKSIFLLGKMCVGSKRRRRRTLYLAHSSSLSFLFGAIRSPRKRNLSPPLLSSLVPMGSGGGERRRRKGAPNSIHASGQKKGGRERKEELSGQNRERDSPGWDESKFSFEAASHFPILNCIFFII